MSGQSLTELALVLPVLLLVVLVAIDFGRVFFGYVTLTNATRIAANYAAAHPTAWGTPGDAAARAQYQQLVLRDTNRANCSLIAGADPVPTPTFVDGSDTDVPDSSTDVGDRVDVSLSCTFRPITPIVGAIVGSSLVMSANADFAVRAGKILGVPIAPAPTPGPTPTPTPTPGPTPGPTPTPCAGTVSFTATNNANGGHPHRMNLGGAISPSSTGWTWTWSGGVNPPQGGQTLNNYDFPASGPTSVTLTAVKGACVLTATQTVNVP